MKTTAAWRAAPHSPISDPFPGGAPIDPDLRDRHDNRAGARSSET
jgi:hypothetical protein